MSNSIAPTPLQEVSAHLLSALQAPRAYPTVSVLLAVTGPRLSWDDHARGRRLLDDAVLRLAYEMEPPAVSEMVDPLRTMLRAMVGTRVQGGIALLRAAGEVHAVRLHVTPEDRAVIDPTFATRDLVRSLAEGEPYGIVVLAKDRARLQVVEAQRLSTEAELDERETEGTDRKGHRHQAQPSRLDQRRSDGFLHRVGLALNEAPSLRALDLVVMAPDHLATRFSRTFRSMHGSKIVGCVSGNGFGVSGRRVVAMTGDVVRRARGERERAVLAELQRADGEGRVGRGVEPVWAIVQRARGAHLVVAHGYAFAAYVGSDGMRIDPAAVPESPGALDDVVDEIIELVLRREGTVSFVSADALGADGVAVIRGGGGRSDARR